MPCYCIILRTTSTLLFILVLQSEYGTRSMTVWGVRRSCRGGERVGSALQNYIVIRVRLGCGNDGQVTLFGLLLSARTAPLLRFLRHRTILATTHKPRVGRSIRPTATKPHFVRTADSLLRYCNHCRRINPFDFLLFQTKVARTGGSLPIHPLPTILRHFLNTLASDLFIAYSEGMSNEG